MRKSKLSWIFCKGTILSILVFFSVSFISFLTQVNPLHYYKSSETYKLDIGFPFTFYRQFWLSGSRIPNSGWTLDNLFYDCFITWIVVAGCYMLIQRRKNKSH